MHESQVAAARSLGLSRWQSLRYVVLPQAVRRVIPPLLNDFISLQKDTALIAVLGPIGMAQFDAHKWREPIGAPPSAAYEPVALEASDGLEL